MDQPNSFLQLAGLQFGCCPVLPSSTSPAGEPLWPESKKVLQDRFGVAVHLPSFGQPMVHITPGGSRLSWHGRFSRRSPLLQCRARSIRQPARSKERLPRIAKQQDCLALLIATARHHDHAASCCQKLDICLCTLEIHCRRVLLLSTDEADRSRCWSIAPLSEAAAAPYVSSTPRVSGNSMAITVATANAIALAPKAHDNP